MNNRPAAAAGVVPSALALTPLLLFLALFFGAGLYFTAHGEAMGFYQLRAPVAIPPALALAAFIAFWVAACLGNFLPSALLVSAT